MSKSNRVRVLNGANLNLLGMREPSIYGSTTFKEIAETCIRVGAELGLYVEFLQSNYEGEVVEWVQTAINEFDAIVINAGAFTHTSIAIHDALRMFDGLKIELHISNPHLREKFRHTSYVSPAVNAVIAGLGVGGYELTIRMLPDILAKS